MPKPNEELRRCARDIYHAAFDLLEPDFAAYIYRAADEMGPVFDEAARMAIGLIEAGFSKREVERFKFRIPGEPVVASALLRAVLARRSICHIIE